MFWHLERNCTSIHSDLKGERVASHSLKPDDSKKRPKVFVLLLIWLLKTETCLLYTLISILLLIHKILIDKKIWKQFQNKNQQIIITNKKILISLMLLPISVFLTAIITCTSCKARTRVVSMPIPLVAPKNTEKDLTNKKVNSCMTS